MYKENDVLAMKKPHPCGGKEWRVIAVSSDVKLRCLKCGRYINLTKDELKKRAKGAKEAGELAEKRESV